MKRLFMIAACVAFVAGCSSISQIPETRTITGYDFRPFSERGFLFTPADFAGRYEAVGFLTLRFTPESNKASFSDATEEARERGFWKGNSYWIYNTVDIDDLLESYYSEATQLGANGVIHFNVAVEDAEVLGVPIPVYTLSGFAIRLLE